MTDPLFDALDEIRKRHVHGQSFAPWRDAAHEVSELWTPEMRAEWLAMKQDAAAWRDRKAGLAKAKAEEKARFEAAGFASLEDVQWEFRDILRGRR